MTSRSSGFFERQTRVSSRGPRPVVQPEGHLHGAANDDFLKGDMIIAKQMGLNALRIHIKPDEPRRLYWADRLGVLLIQDMPNTWRQNRGAREAWEHTMREAVLRDRNHPAIIAWVAFNETWGLGRPEEYKNDRDTQAWVGKMVEEIRVLDGHERLVEDNSPCNNDHVADTDLNSWHFYIDDHRQARRHIEEVVARTKPGSDFNYCPGLSQSSVPLINSEYGAVLGRRRRSRHFMGLVRPDYPVAQASQDPGVRLYRARRHRVGAQRARQLRSVGQGLRL